MNGGSSMELERSGKRSPGSIRHTRGIRRHLIAKELRESRGLLIAGLWTYWLMPTAVEAIPYLGDFLEHQEAQAWACAIMVMVMGWFYAIIAGAHIVCRDWGRAEEHFLRAQPVKSHQIVFAKWCAGLIVVFAVALIASLSDLALCLLGGAGWPLDKDQAPMVFIVPLVMVLGYSCAFVVGFLSRQMLTAVLAACLLLVTLVVAPFLSRRFAVLQSDSFLNEDFRNWIKSMEPAQVAGWACSSLILAISAATLLAAFWAARRESHLRLNTKPVAWTIAGLALGAFGMALSEVGNALPIVDAAPYPAGFSGGYSWASHNLVGYAFGGATGTQIFRVELTSAGRIAEQRIAGLDRIHPDLLPKTSPATSPSEGEWTSSMWAADVEASDAGFIATFQNVGGYLNGSWTTHRLVRVVVAWPSAQDPQLVSLDRRELPPMDLEWRGLACQGRYAYVMERQRDPIGQGITPPPTTMEMEASKFDEGADPDKEEKKPCTLSIHDWERPAGPDNPQRVTIPWPRIRMMRFNDKLVFYSFTDKSQPTIGAISVFDPARPEDIIAAARRETPPVSSRDWQEAFLSQMSREQSAFDSLRSGSVAHDPARHLLFLSDSMSIQTYDQDIKRIGIYQPAWIASLIRSVGGGTGSQVLDGNILLNGSSTSLLFYDTRNPENVRPLGFANLTTSGGAQVQALDRWLVIMDPKGLSVIARPGG